MSRFPTAPGELTNEWLSGVLDRTVRRFECRPLGEGVGVIGMVNRVALETSDGPSSVIVKFAARAPENRAVAVTYDMYGREVHFYRTLAEHVPVRTPRCLAAEHDAGTQDFVLVLEDLGRCRVGDQVAGASVEDAAVVVDALADLHAATWSSRLEGVISHDFPAQREGIAQGFRAGWPAVLARFGDLVPAVARARAPLLGDAIGTLIRRLTDRDQCLVHADVRLDNVLFDGSQVILVDWQSVCTSSGEQDLAYFLTQSLAHEVRARHGEALLERYHRRLLAGGVSGYPWQRCRERYRIASLYLLAWAVLIAGTLDMGNERGLALARALLGRSLSAVTELDAFDLLERA